ncbi:hypothetical protein PISMIDRAFT_687430 [Pisolithus microcarpus 441]|uniref:Uncharacterized protein n=1 Tax=Pisolithus microcarpus 441 TaxID=765257 RepID=A0A0C9XS67_9AGAM|nr:hypothetical protein PISMIDRAFT_687430 [Pisolithus microcarpus 441]
MAASTETYSAANNYGDIVSSLQSPMFYAFLAKAHDRRRRQQILDPKTNGASKRL